jgi:hypothetical protein
MTSTDHVEAIRRILHAATHIEGAEAILLEHDETPVGVTDTARVAVLGTTYAIALAAHTTTDEEIVVEASRLFDELTRNHPAAEVPHLLWSTLIMITTLYAKPAFDRLAELDEDPRPGIAALAQAVSEATEADWEAAEGSERPDTGAAF